MTTAIEFMREHPNPTADDFIKAVALFGGLAVKEAAEQFKNETEPVRQAKCTYCKRVVDVNDQNRRQFIITPRPDWDKDQMDCGCRGW